MDRAEIDENGKGKLFFGTTRVEKCGLVEGQPNVYLLQTSTVLERDSQVSPQAGQFYLIRSKKSGVHYGRPISVYHSESKRNADGKMTVTVQFMILQKGAGTTELFGDALACSGRKIKRLHHRGWHRSGSCGKPRFNTAGRFV